MLILKVILLISFLGLVVIVAKERTANPNMRVKFFEDVERNKRRIQWLFSYIRTLGGRAKHYISISSQASSRVSSRLIQQSLPYGKAILKAGQKGGVLFIRDIKRVISESYRRALRQAREFKEDMKAFEIPGHKRDFLERLHEEKEKSVNQAPTIQAKEETEQDDVIEERSAGGFYVRKIEEKRFVREIEIDKQILQKKEQGLLDAIVRNPKNPNFYKKLGKIYILMNNMEDARNCFEYALKLGAQDPEVRLFLLQIKKDETR